MKKWLRRIRGAVGTGLTWAAAWFAVGTIIELVTLVVYGGGLGQLIANSIGLAVAGFIGGTVFSGVLGIFEGRRMFDELSIPRFAALGAVGGLLLFILLGAVGGGFTIGSMLEAILPALLGAGSAAGSLALARRSEDGDLLEAGEEALGLSEGP